MARPNTHEPETLRQPGGPATHCYLCYEEWRDDLTNEEEKEENVDTVIIIITQDLELKYKLCHRHAQRVPMWGPLSSQIHYTYVE